MKPALLALVLSVVAPHPAFSADKPAKAAESGARKNKFGEPMSPHQIAVEDLAKKHFGKDFDFIVHSQREDGRDHMEITCKIPRASAKAGAIQSKIKSFTAAYHLAGFDSSFMAFAYETRVPDDLGNEQLKMLVHVTLREGLAKQANWKEPEKIRFHALFKAKDPLEDFRQEWESTGAASGK